MKGRELSFRKLSFGEVTMYSMDDCVHCGRMKPAFEEASKRTNTKMSIVSNSTTEGARKIRQAGITSFPTVIGERKGRTHKYEGDRTLQSLIEFSKFIESY